jgi:hypothetical protein
VDNAIKESNNHQTKTDQNLTYDNRRPQIGDLGLHGHAQLQEGDVQSPIHHVVPLLLPSLGGRERTWRHAPPVRIVAVLSGRRLH